MICRILYSFLKQEVLNKTVLAAQTHRCPLNLSSTFGSFLHILSWILHSRVSDLLGSQVRAGPWYSLWARSKLDHMCCCSSHSGSGCGAGISGSGWGFGGNGGAGSSEGGARSRGGGYGTGGRRVIVWQQWCDVQHQQFWLACPLGQRAQLPMPPGSLVGQRGSVFWI